MGQPATNSARSKSRNTCRRRYERAAASFGRTSVRSRGRGDRDKSVAGLAKEEQKLGRGMGNWTEERKKELSVGRSAFAFHRTS